MCRVCAPNAEVHRAQSYCNADLEQCGVMADRVVACGELSRGVAPPHHVVKLSVIMLSVVILRVVMLSVVAPKKDIIVYLNNNFCLLKIFFHQKKQVTKI